MSTYNHCILRLRRGTASEWAASEPQPGGEVLKLGEPGWEKDTGKLKIGDGVTPWNSLPYLQAENSTDVILQPEDVEQAVANILVAGTGINILHDDNNDELIISTSGVILGVNNPGDNRLLTSDGTNTGINAESTLTYQAPTLEISSENTNNRIRLLQVSNTSSEHPRIDFRRNTNTLVSPNPLGSGDFIGSIFFTTLDSSANNSVAAQISTYTPEGLSGYDYTPTQFRISNRTTDGTLSHMYIWDDGTLNPTAGAVINDNAKGTSFGPPGQRAHAMQIFNVSSLNNAENSLGSLSWSFGIVDGSSTANVVVGSESSAYMAVPSGTINSGALVGSSVYSLRNAVTSYDDNGTLALVVGQGILYGNAVWGDSLSPITTVARGINMSPFAGRGSIGTAYDIFLGNTIYDAAIDASGTINYGDGTISTRYGIYQESADPSFLSGSLTVNNGLSSPTKIHDLGGVSGNVSISYAIDKQIQTLTLDGTATNFIEGSGWPATDSVDVLLEITVSSTTSITWTIVDDWYNQPPSLTAGKYLILLRNIGATIQGHYIGEKTN